MHYKWLIYLDGCGVNDIPSIPEQYKQNFDVSSEGPSSGG